MQRIRSVIGWFRRRPVWLADGILAALVAYADSAVVATVGSVEVAGPMRVSPPVAVAVVLAVTLPLVARRLAPIPVAAVTGGAELCGAYLLVPSTGLGVLIAAYTVAAHRSRREAVVVSGALLVGVLVSLAAAGIPQFIVANAVVTAAVAALGDRTRVARERAVALEERARELDREREERLRLAVTAERARIARELHDITAHGVAVIAVQAAGARRVLPADPDRAAEALGEIEDTARNSLAELRQSVSLLRDGAPGAAPQPGLADLPGLLGRFRDAGLLVEAELPEPAPELPPAVGLTVYRVVQEALTNTLRHAGRTRARVRVARDTESICVAVQDDGPAGPGPPPRTGPPGYGLLGLRERVRSRGGELAVWASGDGFRLEARIPLSVPLNGAPDAVAARRSA